MGDEPRHLDPDDSFWITGRGQVYTLIQPDPPVELKDIVEIDGKNFMVIGVEWNLVSKEPGQKIGLLVKPINILGYPDVMPIPCKEPVWRNSRTDEIL